MKLTIIPSDKSVYIDRVCYFDIDMTWIPDIDGKKVHAVQWLDGGGEIEFVGSDQNLKITTLGVFKKAIDLWNEKKEEEDKLIQDQLEQEERLKKEEEERMRSMFIVTPEEEDEDLFYDIEELLKEI
jgi:hypothetical protein